mgnify:CR=1 FL=1
MAEVEIWYFQRLFQSVFVMGMCYAEMLRTILEGLTMADIEIWNFPRHFPERVFVPKLLW